MVGDQGLEQQRLLDYAQCFLFAHLRNDYDPIQTRITQIIT